MAPRNDSDDRLITFVDEAAGVDDPRGSQTRVIFERGGELCRPAHFSFAPKAELRS